MTVRILQGDCRSVLASLPDRSVHMCCTSPPYWGLRSYGIGIENGEIGLETSPDAYVAEMVAVFREVRRVLRDDGTLFLNLGDSYFHTNPSGPQGKSGQRASRTFTAEGAGAQRAAAYDKPGKEPEGSPGHDCLCGSLCDACRAAYRLGKSHSDHSPAPTPSASMPVSIREHRQLASDRLPMSGYPTPHGHTEGATLDPRPDVLHEAGLLPASLASTIQQFEPQLPDAHLPVDGSSSCQLCGCSLPNCAPASARMAGCTCDTAGAASVDRRTGKDVSGSAYPGYTTASLKPKDLIGIPWMVAFALQADGWWLRSDVIWCLSGGTRVYVSTQKGEMPMTIKDMVRLEPATVQLWTGERWTQALGWNQTPRPDRTYEIELRSGQRIGCTANHEWPLEPCGNIRTDELRVGDVIRRCRLPEPSEPRSPSWLMDELAGWFVGLYIAEGSRHDGTINIASHSDETERFERLAALSAALDGTCAVHKTSDNGSTVALNGPMLWGLIDTYVSGELAAGKHLHPRCWQRSDDFLRAVLDGYLAGDGHHDVANNRWRLGFCTNDELVADLRTIGARLGISVRLKRHQHQFAGRLFPGYKGEIRFTRSAHHNNRDDGEIVAIRESRARKFWDIGVEDESHLFALASGVLTHNSKPNPMPESVTDRPTSAHEHVFLLTKSARYFYDAEAVREEGVIPAGTFAAKGSAERFNTPGVNSRPPEYKEYNGTRNCRNVWTIATSPYPDAHFATFPPELAERCIKAGTSEKGACGACGAPWRRVVERAAAVPQRSGEWKATGETHRNDIERKGGFYDAGATTTGWQPSCQCDAAIVPCTVLDPFAGAFTTAMVADRLQRNAIGIELNPNYCAMARKRLTRDAGLFAEVVP